MASRLLYFSPRAPVLRAVAALVFLVAAGTIWAVTLPPRAGWEEPLGPGRWWVIPAGLVSLSLVLPVTMAWLHGRYVLRLEATDRQLLVTTFLLWGTRTQTVDRHTPPGARVTAEGRRVLAFCLRQPAAGIDWWFDFHGEFPSGVTAITELVDDPIA